ncbi:MAG: hypothetical protein WC552_01835 [Candidatus Omnitrophota bacterium]
MKKILIMALIALGSLVMMLMAGSLLLVVYLVKLFRKVEFRDRFHDSRRHPLNSPSALRG